MKSRLQEKYRSETVPALMKHFGWKNMMAVPKLKKVTVNIGLGEASQNAKLLDTAAVELGQITGQKPIITRAKKSIANFKIRKGMPIGCAVTLRVDLNKVVGAFIDVAAERRDDPGGHRAAEPERVADRGHPIADLSLIAVAPGDEGQLVLGVDLDQGEVGFFVTTDDLGRVAAVVLQDRGNLRGIRGDIGVRSLQELHSALNNGGE